jgi:hypothetical protein
MNEITHCDAFLRVKNKEEEEKEEGYCYKLRTYTVPSARIWGYE